MIFIIAYNVIFSTFIAFMILDWVLGIDKLSPRVNDFLEEHFPDPNESVITPIIGLSLLSVIGSVLYLCTSAILIWYITVFCTGAVLTLIVLSLLFYTLYYALNKLREFILSKKVK